MSRLIVRILLTSMSLLAVSPAAAAWADRGVAVDVGRIDVDEMLQPGQTYTLPAIGVRNPGSQPSTYRLAVSPVETELLAVPEEWVRITPASLRLDADESQQVQPELAVPVDAEPGEYETLLAAQLDGAGEGAQIGAAAATRLSFAVGGEPAPPPDAGGVRGGGWLMAGLLAVALTAVARRFKGLRIRIERQT